MSILTTERPSRVPKMKEILIASNLYSAGTKPEEIDKTKAYKELKNIDWDYVKVKLQENYDLENKIFHK